MSSPFVRRRRLAVELRTLREQRGMTADQLACRIHQSRMKISKLENAHIRPDLAEVMKITPRTADGRTARSPLRTPWSVFSHMAVCCTSRADEAGGRLPATGIPKILVRPGWYFYLPNDCACQGLWTYRGGGEFRDR